MYITSPPYHFHAPNVTMNLICSGMWAKRPKAVRHAGKALATQVAGNTVLSIRDKIKDIKYFICGTERTPAHAACTLLVSPFLVPRARPLMVLWSSRSPTPPRHRFLPRGRKEQRCTSTISSTAGRPARARSSARPPACTVCVMCNRCLPFFLFIHSLRNRKMYQQTGIDGRHGY